MSGVVCGLREQLFLCHVCTEMCLFLLLMVTPRANCTFNYSLC